MNDSQRQLEFIWHGLFCHSFILSSFVLFQLQLSYTMGSLVVEPLDSNLHLGTHVTVHPLGIRHQLYEPGNGS